MVKRICYNTRYGNGTFNPCAALLRVALAALPTMTAFGQALPGTVSRTVEVYPGAEKNKAFPLERGSGMCDLTLRARSPWRIRDSNIVNPVSDETLWKKFSPTRYKMSYGYAPDEFVQIEGDLYKPTTGSGEGKVELPDFLVTVPAVNLDWDAKHGDAAKEFAEDSVPAAILVSSDRADFGSLIVDMKFGVEIGHKAGNLWQTRDVVYWYGVSPDRLGYTYLDVFGSNPKRKIHKAYQKPEPESYEVR